MSTFACVGLSGTDLDLVTDLSPTQVPLSILVCRDSEQLTDSATFSYSNPRKTTKVNKDMQIKTSFIRTPISTMLGSNSSSGGIISRGSSNDNSLIFHQIQLSVNSVVSNNNFIKETLSVSYVRCT